MGGGLLLRGFASGDGRGRLWPLRPAHHDIITLHLVLTKLRQGVHPDDIQH